MGTEPRPAEESFRDELRRHAKGVAWAPLGRLLEGPEPDALFAHYDEADRAAGKLRAWHRAITIVAATAGTLALLLALGQLSKKAWEEALWPVEGVMAGIALLAVLVGLIAKFHHRWLHERVRAERLRLAVFGALADGRFWKSGSPAASWDRLKDHGLTAWAESGTVPEIPTCGDDVVPPPEGVTRFYLDTRLRAQERYFEKKEIEERRRTWDDPSFVATIFFLSVALALIHVLIDVINPEHQGTLQKISHGLLVTSAVLPIAFMGVRTWRSANESARNVARVRAKNSQLVDLEKSLADARDGRSSLITMRLSEALLEEEQREWLRLMRDAEWFG